MKLITIGGKTVKVYKLYLNLKIRSNEMHGNVFQSITDECFKYILANVRGFFTLFFHIFALSNSMCFIHSHGRSISNFSCSLTRNITSHSIENLAFHSLLR